MLRVLRCAKHATQRPKTNANQSRISEKNVNCVESLRFCRSSGNVSFERGGVGPPKQCSFWFNGPSVKAPQIPLGHQKTMHLALF